MRNFLRPTLFMFFLTAVFLLLDALCYDGSSSMSSVSKDMKSDHYDLVFIGASKQLFGVDPLLINESLGIKTVNYVNPGMPEDLMYETLRFILSDHSVDAIVLDGVRLWINSEREFREDMQTWDIYPFYDGIRDPFLRAKLVLENVPKDYKREYPECFTQLFRDLEVKKFMERLTSPAEKTSYLGFQEQSLPPSDYVNIPEISAHFREDYQENCSFADMEMVSWFEKSIQLAKEKGITVYLTVLPDKKYGKSLGKRLCALDRLAEKYDNVRGVWNLPAEMTDMGISYLDFYDTSHLNRMGAKKNTERIIEKLGADMGITPDYSKVAMYRGENLEPIGDDLYRYSVDVYPNTEIRFQYVRGEEIVSETEYGETKEMELHKLGADEKLNFCVRPKVVYEDTFPVEERCYSFLLTPDALEMEERSKEVSAVGDGDQK